MSTSRGKLLTSLSRARFEELRHGIIDGSLAERWRELEGKPPEQLTRKQAVELRQLAWLAGLWEGHPDAIREMIDDPRWHEVKVFDRGDGMAETVAYRRR